eukprot:782025_1
MIIYATIWCYLLIIINATSITWVYSNSNVHWFQYLMVEKVEVEVECCSHVLRCTLIAWMPRTILFIFKSIIILFPTASVHPYIHSTYVSSLGGHCIGHVLL